MMDDAWRRLASRDRIAECHHRHPRRQRPIQCPADRLAGEPIDDHRQKHELDPQSDIGDVGYPKLVDATHSHARCQVHMYFVLMLRIGCEDVLAVANRQQVIFAHDP